MKLKRLIFGSIFAHIKLCRRKILADLGYLYQIDFKWIYFYYYIQLLDLEKDLLLGLEIYRFDFKINTYELLY